MLARIASAVIALTATAAAQLPAPTLIQRAAPRAAWSTVTSAGTTIGATTTPPTVNGTFRADNPGAVGMDKLWVFGGSLGNNTNYTANDLWAFDPVAGTMTQMIADGVAGSPAHRSRSAIAWNPVNNKLTVFGGDSRGGPTGAGTAALLGDTWEYDPTTNTWADVTPALSPSPRRWAAMTYDPITNGLLLFGGQTTLTSPPAYSNETWLWLGGVWLPLSPTTVPTARALHSMVTRDDSFQDVVMLGGDNSTMAAPDLVRFLDVWRWTGSDWSLLSNCDVLTNPTGAGTTWPASTIGNQAVYDPLRQRIVVQGGNGITVAANTTYVYGPNFGGSPTNYTSEFDSLSNSWSIYANPTTGSTPWNNTDSVIGRVSRYFAGFIPATGRIYKACGQDPTKSGSKPTYSVYAYQASTLAAATTVGAGCTGPGGQLTLTANGAPWTGRTWTATCTNLGPLSLAMQLWGFNAAAFPLSVVFPIAPLGCDLLNTADLLLGPDPVVGGQTTVSLPIPSSPSLAGATLHVQIAEMELDLAFNWVGLYTSNGIGLTVGAL